MYIRSPRSCTSVQLVGNAYFRAAFYRVVERGFENFFLPRCRGTISRTLRARNPAREISALFPLFCVFSTFFFFFFRCTCWENTGRTLRRRQFTILACVVTHVASHNHDRWKFKLVQLCFEMKKICTIFHPILIIHINGYSRRRIIPYLIRREKRVVGTN